MPFPALRLGPTAAREKVWNRLVQYVVPRNVTPGYQALRTRPPKVHPGLSDPSSTCFSKWPPQRSHRRRTSDRTLQTPGSHCLQCPDQTMMQGTGVHSGGLGIQKESHAVSFRKTSHERAGSGYTTIRRAHFLAACEADGWLAPAFTESIS